MVRLSRQETHAIFLECVTLLVQAAVGSLYYHRKRRVVARCVHLHRKVTHHVPLDESGLIPMPAPVPAMQPKPQKLPPSRRREALHAAGARTNRSRRAIEHRRGRRAVDAAAAEGAEGAEKDAKEEAEKGARVE